MTVLPGMCFYIKKEYTYKIRFVQIGEMSKVIRKHIVCYGWVQGVGFRYRARHAANLYGVTGWVRNDPSGSVTMEVQGTEDQIDKVIIAIERGSYVIIEHMDVKPIPVIEHDRDFRTVG